LNSPVPIFASERREALRESGVMLKNTTQCSRPGLKPGTLHPDSSILTMRPPPYTDIIKCPVLPWKCHPIVNLCLLLWRLDASKEVLQRAPWFKIEKGFVKNAAGIIMPMALFHC